MTIPFTFIILTLVKFLNQEPEEARRRLLIQLVVLIASVASMPYTMIIPEM